jgi:hypothetical protein
MAMVTELLTTMPAVSLESALNQVMTQFTAMVATTPFAPVAAMTSSMAVPATISCPEKPAMTLYRAALARTRFLAAMVMMSSMVAKATMSSRVGRVTTLFMAVTGTIHGWQMAQTVEAILYI